jgi:hypothetical protein
VRHEGKGVYRIGFVDDLFRLIGFYEDGTSSAKSSFICAGCFLKRGQKLDAPQREIIDEVSRIKTTGDWRKIEYPRSAEES